MLCELSVQCRSHEHVTPTTAPVQGPTLSTLPSSHKHVTPTTAPVQGPTLPTLPSSCPRSACTTRHHMTLHGTSWPVGNALDCRPSGKGFDSLHGRMTVFLFIILLLLVLVCLLLMLLFCVLLFFVLLCWLFFSVLPFCKSYQLLLSECGRSWDAAN